MVVSRVVASSFRSRASLALLELFLTSLFFYHSIFRLYLHPIIAFVVSLSIGSFKWWKRMKLFVGSCCLWSRGLCRFMSSFKAVSFVTQRICLRF